MATKRLGKGLQALIPEVSEDGPHAGGKDAVREIELSRISPNPFQPRTEFNPTSLAELKQSISENGLITPISVRPHHHNFQLIAGERRLRAVQELGYAAIPAFVIDIQDDGRMLELALIENVQREDLNPIDEALGYQRLIDECQLTQEVVAQKVGKERTTVANSLRLLKLAPAIQESLRRGEISAGHARALLSFTDRQAQARVWKKVVKDQLSVRQVERLAKSARRTKSTKAEEERQVPSALSEIENRLRRILGTQVRIQTKGDKGSVEIEYYSRDELERILELLLTLE